MTYPSPSTPTKTIGLREVCEVNGHHFKRLKGTQTWTKYSPPTPDTSPTTTTNNNRHEDEEDPIYLSLIHETQLPSEPIHWSLFVARENQPGQVYQVKGDAEHMIYEPSRELVDITLSPDFATLFQLTTLNEEQARAVGEVARGEKPPWAVNRKAVRENCQGWCVRVLEGLVGRGFVGGEKLGMVRRMVQPV